MPTWSAQDKPRSCRAETLARNDVRCAQSFSPPLVLLSQKGTQCCTLAYAVDASTRQSAKLCPKERVLGKLPFERSTIHIHQAGAKVSQCVSPALAVHQTLRSTARATRLSGWSGTLDALLCPCLAPFSPNFFGFTASIFEVQQQGFYGIIRRFGM